MRWKREGARGKKLMHWRLTLILSSTVFAFIFTLRGMTRFIVKYQPTSLSLTAQGSTLVEETISAIRNTIAFNAQDTSVRQYDAQLARAEPWGVKAGASMGLLNAFIMCYIYLTYSLAFWQGSRYLVWGILGFGDVLTIVMSIMLGAFAVCNVTPNYQAFTASVAAATKVYAVIDRVCPLDLLANSVGKLKRVEGTIELRNIRHVYPSRPRLIVTDNVSLHIPSGKTTALGGVSGSGKSTIIGLIERFYNPI